MNKKTRTTTEAIEELTFEIGGALEGLRMGEFYGDPLPDSLACIATSLRILSGREKLKK